MGGEPIYKYKRRCDAGGIDNGEEPPKPWRTAEAALGGNHTKVSKSKPPIRGTEDSWEPSSKSATTEERQKVEPERCIHPCPLTDGVAKLPKKHRS